MDTLNEDALIGYLAVKLSNKVVEDYLIHSCKFSRGKYHDIIARVKLKGVWYLLLIQARFKPGYDDGFNPDYFKEALDSHRENIRFIIFCDSNVEAVVSPRNEHDEIMLLFGENYRKFGRDSDLFLKELDCLKNQVYINEGVAKYLEDYFKDEYLRNQGLTKDIFEVEIRKIHLLDFIVDPRLLIPLIEDDRIDIWNKIALNNGIIFINDDGDNIEGCLYQCCVKRINDLLKVIIDWNFYVGQDQILPEIIGEKFREYSEKKGWRSWIHPPKNLKSLLIDLWKYRDLPLILKSNIDFQDLTRSYIIVNNSICPHKISDINNETLRGDILENTRISLQGRPPITLDELTWKNEITLKDIIQFMRDLVAIPIIGPTIAYDELDYIPRSLRIPSIFSSYFNLKETKICLLSGDVDTLHITVEFLPADLVENFGKFTFESKSYFIKIKNEEQRDYWSKLSSFGYPILDFNIRYGIMELLRYLNCNIKDLRSYFWYYNHPEEYFFENLGNIDQIVVITGDPGVGKTSFLKSLYNKSTTPNYIIFYDLKQIQNDMPQPIKNITMEFILEQFHKNGGPEFNKFIQNLCRNEKLILILDSFDEIIDTSYESEIIEFLRCCDNSTRIIIASRLSGLNLLKTVFDLQVLKLDSLDKSGVQKYAGKLKLNLQDVPEDFTTNPSHLNYLKLISPQNFDTLTLYEEVIDIKIKDSLKEPSSSMEIDEIKSLFEKLALTAVFGANQIKERLNWVNDHEISTILKYGIVVDFDKSPTIPIFYDFTLEFFISRWFINANHSKQHQSLIEDFYRQMFDEGNLHLLNLTCEDLDLHKAIVRNDVYKVLDLCQDDRNSLNTPDKLGRLAIHVATIRCRGERRNTPYLILREIIRSMQQYYYDLGQFDAILRLDWVSHINIDMFERIFYYDYIDIIRIYLSYERRNKISNRQLLLQFLQNFFRETFLMGLKHFSLDILYDLLFLQNFDNEDFHDLIRNVNNTENGTILCNNDFKTYGNLKPLHIACLHGNTVMVKKIIEFDLEVNSSDDFYYTPLDYSIFYACVRIKSSFKMIFPEENESTTPPIYKQNENIKLLELLLENGAENAARENSTPEHYHTPLCVAARSGNLDAVKMLLNTNIRNHLCGEDCRIRLHIAAITQNFDLIKLLIQDDTTLNSYDDYQNAPLQYAVETDNVEIVKMLFNIHTPINTRNKSCETPLHRAVKKKNIDIIETLLKAGANPNLQNRRGETPLHYAVKLKNEKFVDKIQIIADHNVTNIESDCGDIPLYTAEKMPTMDKTRLSLIIGAVLNSGDKTFYHSTQKNMDIIKILLQSGADCKIRNMNRITPLDYVVEMRDEDTIKLFIKRKKRCK